MNPMLWIIWGLSLLMVLGAIYFLYVNERAHKQTMALIAAYRSLPAHPERMRWLEAFASKEQYNRHLWCVFFFRDPAMVYPEWMRPLIKQTLR